MAKTQDIKRRIRSVKNTMQLTRAMKMVAAAKLRRAQERMLDARPYAQRLHRLLRSAASRVSTDDDSLALLQVREPRRTELAVFTGDRGLCGAFNSGIIRAAESFARFDVAGEVTYAAVGKKGKDHFRRTAAVRRSWIDVFRVVEYATAKEIAADLMQRYIDGEVDAIHLCYNEFKSAMQARPVVLQILPIQPAEVQTDESPEDYIYEPSARDILESLLPHYVENQVFRAMLESVAAEHAARMSAMESATKNAGELIENLTLTMNRVRQASITTEIIEVVSGAEALG